MDRKKNYLMIAKKSLPRIISMQDMRMDSATKGCFFYPYWRGECDYVNARWQEAVLTLSWFYRKNGKSELKLRAEAGIDFWCSIQNGDGSFTEDCRGDRCFSATAFSLLAVSEAVRILGCKDEWLPFMKKAGDWLCRNDERVLINQETAAAAALSSLYTIVGERRYLRCSEKKLSAVLRSQSSEGWFAEMGGCDVGYSSLTLEMLGLCHIATPKGGLLHHALEFVKFFNGAVNVKNVRRTGWIITDGFEIFSKQLPEAKESLRKIFSGKEYDFVHLPDERHLCTDTYRHLWAHDHVCYTMDVNPSHLPEPAYFVSCRRVLRPLRRLGIHRFRKIAYFWCLK